MAAMSLPERLNKLANLIEDDAEWFSTAEIGDEELIALLREAARATTKHPNGAPMFAPDGMMLDDKGNRSIFDDVDE